MPASIDLQLFAGQIALGVLSPSVGYLANPGPNVDISDVPVRYNIPVQKAFSQLKVLILNDIPAGWDLTFEVLVNGLVVATIGPIAAPIHFAGVDVAPSVIIAPGSELDVRVTTNHPTVDVPPKLSASMILQ